jgi:hypothetical protein
MKVCSSRWVFVDMAGQRWAVTRAWNACPLNDAGPTIASPNKTTIHSEVSDMVRQMGVVYGTVSTRSSLLNLFNH